MLSRVADSLFWMSRYLERAEHTARTLDVTMQTMMDYAPAQSSERCVLLVKSLGADLSAFPTPMQPYDVTRELIFNDDSTSSISTSIQIARENARQVRQQISSEMWEQVNSIYHRLRIANMDDIWRHGPHGFLTDIKTGVHLFQGITDSTLTQGEGWHFIQIGKFLERATSIARLLSTTFAREHMVASDPTLEAGEYLEWVALLKSCTAFEAYCKVYTANIRPDRIAEFLLLNPIFPHSVAFCATTIHSSLESISALTEVPRNARINRLAGKLCASLDFSNISEIFSGGLDEALANVQAQCNEIHDAVNLKYIAYPMESALPS